MAGQVSAISSTQLWPGRQIAGAPKRKGRRHRLRAEQLERRYALDAVPFASVVGPVDSNQLVYTPLIGEVVPFVVSFDNTATNPADIGYSPFVDIVMPKTGDSPPTPENGIEFDSGSATYQGKPLQATELTFDAQGNATHPFAKDAAGKPLVVTGKPGDQLVVVQLPFGSFAPDQPKADINFTGTVNALAQPGQSYPVTAKGGFRYQLDTAGNPTVDHASLGTLTTDTLQPQLFRLSKTTNAPEHETVTGPNFEHTYSVNVAVAPQQTVTNLLLTDVLPGNIQFTADTTPATGGGTRTKIPTTTQPGGTLEYEFASVTGTGNDTDAVMSFTYYVPRQDANSVDVIPLGTGGQKIITNPATASGDWTSANQNFPNPQTVHSNPSDPGSQVILTAKTLGVQKSLRNTSRAAGYRVGDTIEYTLRFEVSDYFALGSAVLSDVLSDGQAFDHNFPPTLEYVQHSQSLPLSDFQPSNVTVTTNANGTQDVRFSLSSELQSRSLASGNQLLGAGVPLGGTGSSATLPDPPLGTPGTKGVVTFRAKVIDDYRVPTSQGSAVVQGDQLFDTAQFTAAVLKYEDLSNTYTLIDDGSRRNFTLTSGKAHKEVFAINGVAPTANQRINPGDDVTFRITYDVPFSSINDYRLTDFLPLPIFPASALTSVGGGASSTPPPAGQWGFGPTDTFSGSTIGGPIPTVSANASSNSLVWDFTSFNDPQNRDGKTDILFTVTATNRPFGDGLLLTNQAQQSEKDATGKTISSNAAITQVTMSEPELAITKGVVSTNNPTGEFVQNGSSSTSPPLPAGVSFTAPGQNPPAFTGTITSSDLSATPIDATLENALGDDLVKFSIVVENTGSSPNGAFDVTIADTLEPRYRIPTNVTGLNLQVTDGAGTSLAYVGDLFSGGITLIDQGPSIASDNAAPYQAKTYTTNSPPPNNGTGFGNWVIVAPTASGSFVGTTALSTTTGTKTFGVTSNGSGENASIRLFANPLSDGQAFSADVAVNTFNNGTKGFGFHAIGDTSDIFSIRLYVNAGTGNWKYKLSNSATVTDTTIPFVADAPIKVRVEQTSGTKVLVSMQQAGSPAWSEILTVPNRIDSAGFSSLGSSSPGKQSNIGFDNLEITGAATAGALGPGKQTDGTVINDGKNIAVVTYDLQIRPTVAPLDVIPNTGKVTNYASIEGGPNFVSAAGIKDDTNVTIQGPEVTKTLVKTEIDDLYNTNTQAVIGEIATYNLRVDVPRGTTPNAIVTDTLSKALGFVKVTNVQLDSGVSIGNTSGANNPTLSTDGSGNNLATFNLGDITNTNPDTQRHGLTITFEAVVLNDRSVKSTSPAIHNKAKLDWTGHSLPDVSAGPLTIIEPRIGLVKQVSPGHVEAGERVTYTIDVSGQHTTAYDIKLDDFFPVSGITYVPGSIKTNGVGNPTTIISGGGSALQVTWAKLTPGQTSRITFEATVNSSVISGQRIRNTATATWTSLGNASQITKNYANAYQRTGSGSTANNQLNNYTHSARADLRVEKPHVTKTLVSTSIENTHNTKTQAVIGETATYEITVTIPQGRTPSARLLDWMGDRQSTDQLAYVSSSVPVTNSSALTVPGLTDAPLYDGTTTQRTVRWDFGDIVNADNDPNTKETITFAVVTRLLNVNNNIQGVSVTNNARLEWSRRSHSNVAKNNQVTVIEPKLTTAKTAVVGGLGGNPGDPVTYTIVIQQDAASATDAYDVTLEDLIPTEIASPVLVSVVDTAPVNPVSKSNFDLSGNSLTTKTPFDVSKDPGRTITLTIAGTLQGPFSANQQIVNTSTVVWTSLPNSSGPLTPNPASSPYNYERTGPSTTNLGQLNNYSVTSQAIINVNTADLVVEKTVDNRTPNVGDTITFTVTVRNDGPNTATGVVLTDTFPSAGLDLDVTGVTQSPGTTFSYGPSTGADTREGTWTIGTLANGASVTLTLPATVKDPAVDTIPATWTNTATITAVNEPDPKLGNNTDTATETPKYADLAVLKKTSNERPNDGQPVQYTITLTNKGEDTATNVELTDVLPDTVTYVSSTPDAGTTFTTTTDPITGTITGGIWSVPTITKNQTLTLLIDVVANSGDLRFNEITITKTDTWDPVSSNNSSRTPIDPQDADVEVSKTVDQLHPQVGDNVTFTVTVTNNGPDTSKAVKVTDTLPPELQLFGTPVTSKGTYTPGTGIWDVGDMVLNEVQTLTIEATVLAPSTSTGPGANITNTAEGHSTGLNPTPDPNLGNNRGSAFVTPLQSDLVVVKGVSDATPNVGDVIQFIIGAANSGPADATLVSVTDVIPTGLTYLGPTSGLGTNPTSGTPSKVGGTLTWDIGVLPSGSVEFFVFDARVEAPTPDGIPPKVTNTAVISGKEYDPDPTNNTDSVDETPLYADLVVDKQVSTPTPNVGDIITYTITVTNKGHDTATDVVLVDTLPSLPDLEIHGTPRPSVGTFDKITGIWTIGTIFPNKSVTLSVQAKVLAPAAGNPVEQKNMATVTAKQYDPDPTNNSHSVSETPKYADLVVTKTVDQPAPNVGENVTFTIVVENNGNDPATNVFIDDVLPPGLLFFSTSLPGDYVGGVWNVGTVDVGPANAKTLTVTATVTASGTMTNEAEVSTTNPPPEFDPDPSNNKGSATVKTREADLVVTKTVDNASPNVNDLINFTVTVRNDGPDTANNIEIKDHFPTSGLSLVAGNVVASSGTYHASTGIWEISSLANGAQATLLLPAKVLPPAVDTIPPTQTNVAEVQKVDEHDPKPLNNIGQVSETPKHADLAVTKTTTNVQPNVGDIFTYTVTLENLGPATATNVEVTETYPPNISVLQVIPPNGTQFNPAVVGGGIWSIPSIAPMTREVLVIHAQAMSAGVAYNKVRINHSDVWDPDKKNNEHQTPTDPQQADLFLTKTVDNPRPEVLDQVTFTLTLENLGPTDAQSVTVNDTLPNGLKFISANPASDYNDTTGIWTVGSLAASATTTLTIIAEVKEPVGGAGPVSDSTNRGTATSPTVDPDLNNNSSKVTVSPLQADLAVSKTASNSRPQIGSLFSYTIEVSNLGPDTASNAYVIDQLDSGVKFDSYTATTGSYDHLTGRWDIGTVTTADRPSLTITVAVNTGNSGGQVPNTATVDSGTWDPDRTNNTSSVIVVVPPRGVIIGTDVGCETGPFVRVIDPDTGENRITPFFAYEPEFRGGVRVYGADVTGDGFPNIITAPGPGRPGEVRVFKEDGTPIPEYSFFPFGPNYFGGIEIAAGSLTAKGAIEIVAGQSRGGTVNVFEVTPGAAQPVATSPSRRLQPFGSNFLGGVFVETADVGTYSGSTQTSPSPDEIMELFVGSGFGMVATVSGYNAQPATPVSFNNFKPLGGSTAGASVARLPSSIPNTVDKIIVSAGPRGGSLVETYSGTGSTREAFFQAYGNDRAQVFTAAIDETALFNVQGLLGTVDGVQKSLSTSGSLSATLPQSTVSYPPLRVSILRN